MTQSHTLRLITISQGAELGHVICSPTAAGAIKSYAPDLIVHPMLKEETQVISSPFIISVLNLNSTPEILKPELSSLLERLHVLVVGPGLGREDYMQNFARLAVTIAKEQKMYLVLDADALWMVGKDINIIKGYNKAVLTPNVMEFKRLSEAVVSLTILASPLSSGLTCGCRRTSIQTRNLPRGLPYSRSHWEASLSSRKGRRTSYALTRHRTPKRRAKRTRLKWISREV